MEVRQRFSPTLILVLSEDKSSMLFAIFKSSPFFHHTFSFFFSPLYFVWISFLVRHCFVNEAYDNLDSMRMTPTTNTSEYAQPVTANANHPPAQSLPSQEPAVFLTGISSQTKLLFLLLLFVCLLSCWLARGHQQKKSKSVRDRVTLCVRLEYSLK